MLTTTHIRFSKRPASYRVTTREAFTATSWIKSLSGHSGKLLRAVPAGRYSRRPLVAREPHGMVELAAAAVSPARERILEAAERVVGDVGAARLTLDSVAQAAGVSKGGLLYHFPSKEVLLCALAKRYVETMSECVEQAKTDLGETGGRDLKACIVGILEQQPRAKMRGMGAALLAAAANDLTLLEVIRERIAQYMQQIESSNVDFARAAIVTLA